MISLFSTPAEPTLPASANAATHGISHPVHRLAIILGPFSFLVFTKSCPRYLYETQGPLLCSLRSLQPTFVDAVSTAQVSVHVQWLLNPRFSYYHHPLFKGNPVDKAIVISWHIRRARGFQDMSSHAQVSVAEWPKPTSKALVLHRQPGG